MQETINTTLTTSTVASGVRATIASTKEITTGRGETEGARGESGVSLAAQTRADKAKKRKEEAEAAAHECEG